MVIRNVSKPCSVPKHRSDISQGEACKMWSSVSTNSLYASDLPERKAFYKGKFFDLCTHLLPHKSWPRSWSWMYGNQQGSFRSVWLGRWGNICRAEERSAWARLAPLQGGLQSPWADAFSPSIIPIYQSAFLACLSSSMSCCVIPAPGLKMILQGKAGSGIPSFALAVFSHLFRAFSTLIA